MFAKPRDDYSLPREAENPPVMAIGDSLFNGMRSATINAELARLSAPALVARALTEDDVFVAPAYPDHILIDLEAEMRRLDFPLGALAWFQGLKKRVRANARAWLDGEHALAHPAQFDNLAISGAEIEHLSAVKLKHVKADLARWKSVVDRFDDPLDWPGQGVDLMGLHMAINTRFLLDPADTGFFDEMAPIDFVELRRPQRLLVNIGPNHGLIDLTQGGSWDPRDDGTHNRLEELPRKVAEFAPLLKGLGPGVKHIYFSNLPKPSQVPNMMPVDPDAERTSTYFDGYENRLGGLHDYRVYSKKEMREVDKFVASINARVADALSRAFGADNRLHIFDFWGAFNRYDYKHSRRKALRPKRQNTNHPNRTYGNNAFHVDWRLFGRAGWPGARAGGLGSLDNHHPSTLGYTVMARHLLDLILKAEAEDPPAAGTIERRPLAIGDKEDTLLGNLPAGWANAPWTLLNVRRALQGRGDAGPEDHANAKVIDEALKIAPIHRPAR